MECPVGVKGWAYGIPRGQGVGLEVPRRSTGRFDESSDDFEVGPG